MEAKETFRLWYEYLKRSRRYEAYCQHMRAFFQDPSLPRMPEEFKTWDNINEVWEMWTRFLDIHTFTFDQLWDSGHCFFAEYQGQGSAVTVTKNPDEPFTLSLQIDLLSSESHVEIADQVKALIKEKRKALQQLRRDLNHTFIKAGTHLRPDELRLYLAVYDLKVKHRLPMKEIITRLAPNEDPSNSSTKRKFWQYLRKACAVIRNAESGTFPGPY